MSGCLTIQYTMGLQGSRSHKNDVLFFYLAKCLVKCQSLQQYLEAMRVAFADSPVRIPMASAGPDSLTRFGVVRVLLTHLQN